jgi:acetolactate synthase-1/2/3 large subunit
MNIKEMQTVVHNKLPLIIFLFNNEGYMPIKLTRQTYLGQYIGSDSSSSLICLDIVKLATAHGMRFEWISNQKELCQRLDAVLAESGLYDCEIMIPGDQPLIPRISSLKLPDGRIIAKPLEDIYSFLDRKEFRENMFIVPAEVLNK